MAGGFVVGKNPNYVEGGNELEYMGDVIASIYALCFGDTIIAVLENKFPQVIPEITFIYDTIDTIDFSTLDQDSFNKTMKILKDYFDDYQNTKEDNAAEDTAKRIWLWQVYPYVLKDERYDPNYEVGE